MSKLRHSIGMFAAVALCTALAACQSPGGGGAACARNADCSEPLTCALGRCRAQCREARDCPIGSRCIALASAAVCALDQENDCDTTVCPSPLVCTDHQCRTVCTRDPDCVSGPCTSGTCSEPTRTTDAAPVARMITTAFFTNWHGPTFGSGGMSRAGYQVSTDGVRDGDLLLLIGCIDNGSTTVWPSPLAPGFAQLEQETWGSDQQTCVVAWHIAAAEPPSYAGTYGQGINSGSSVLALVAVSGARGVDPIARFVILPGAGPDVDPVVASSPGLVTTTRDTLVLYAASADWTCDVAHAVSATVPAGFSTLVHLGDHGSETCDWTWLQIESSAVHDPGTIDAITSTQTSATACTGTAWTAAIAIEP